MKVYLVYEGDLVRMVCLNIGLASAIQDAFYHLNLRIHEVDVIGD